jgi:hypothetical protein
MGLAIISVAQLSAQLPPFEQAIGFGTQAASGARSAIRAQGCPPYAGYAFPAGPLPSAAWAAARRAMGTRNGEHET